jgi:hypothetical protein
VMIVNDELGKLLNKAVVSYLRHSVSILEGYVSQDDRSAVRVSNPDFPCTKQVC